jgi:hypothetical protein
MNCPARCPDRDGWPRAPGLAVVGARQSAPVERASRLVLHQMAAGGRNPQKSAAARAKKEKLAGADKNKGGGAAGKAARGGDAGSVASAFEAAAAERAAKNAEKAKRDEEKKKKEEVEARRKKKEAEAAAKKAGAAKGGGGAGGGAAGDAKLKALEQQLMPLVKKGDALQEAGDLDAALALYQESMDGFRSAGYKRPKLKEKLDAIKAKMAAEPEPEPAVDQSVEIDASVEAGA